MKEELQEKLLAEFMVKAKEQLNSIVNGIMGDFYSEHLPYVLEDTEFNAQARAEDIVKQIASGNFEREGDYVRVKHPTGGYQTSLRIAMTDYQYDHLRDNLIKSMPKCPKDAKIEALQRQLKEQEERFYATRY